MERELIQFVDDQNTNCSVQIFKSEQFGEIRTAGTAENPMFCLADVCRVLDIQQTKDVKSRLNNLGVDSIPVWVQTGFKKDGTPALRETNMTFISEMNLYKVIMRSDKDKAEPFQDWVCGEVLPSIRKHGGYIATSNDMTDDEIMAKALMVAQKTIERRDQRIKELESSVKESEKKLIEANTQVEELSAEIQTMKPKVTYYDMILNNKSTVLTTQIAQDYGMSAKALNKKLNEMHIQHKVGDQWILYAAHISQGYMHSKPVEIQKKDGTTIIKYNSEWTQKGRLFLYDELKKVGILPLIEK